MGHKKQEAMKIWRELPDNMDIKSRMRAIPYKATGSTYGAGGLRIDGDPEFIKAILSHLKPILDLEDNFNRLGLAWNDVKPTEVQGNKKDFGNATQGAQVVYIRLHQRGKQAQAMNNMVDAFGNHEDEDVV